MRWTEGPSNHCSGFPPPRCKHCQRECSVRSEAFVGGNWQSVFLSAELCQTCGILCYLPWSVSSQITNPLPAQSTPPREVLPCTDKALNSSKTFVRQDLLIFRALKCSNLIFYFLFIFFILLSLMSRWTNSFGSWTYRSRKNISKT